MKLLNVIFIFSSCALAQSTTVTGTVTDPNGVPYGLGTINAQLVVPSGAGTPKLGSSPYIPPTQATGLDSTGFFRIQLADNTQLTPAGTTWNFKVCSGQGSVQPSIGKGPVCFTLASGITISGSGQDISAQLNAAALPLTNLVDVTSTSVINAWGAGCNSLTYLRGDGSCATPAGAGLPGIVSATNAATGNDPNDRRMVDFTATYDGSTSNPNFSDENNFQIVENVTNGQANYGNATHAKKTQIPLAVSANYQGSGQKLLFNKTVNCFSMSDCAAESTTVTFAGGPIAGDEGQGFSVVSSAVQQSHLNLSTISSVTQSACNTTLTQNVTASVNVQTFTVASSTGCNVNDWVVLALEPATGAPAESLMQITAVSAGSLSGQVIGNYSIGNTVTPATVLTTAGDGAGPWGQDRVLVNLTATPYTTGTVTTISGGSFTGSGTGWSNGMVGGNATIVGCIALTNDDFTAAPFNGSGGTGTLKSWYQIIGGTVSATNVGVMSQSVAGDAAYHGRGAGSGAYTVRPCAKVLRVSSNSQTVILESNSFTWNVNDSIEELITPYPDISGFQYSIGQWNPGGTRRAFLGVKNNGARTFQYGVLLTGQMPVGGGADDIPWQTGINIGTNGIGVAVDNSRTGAAFAAFAETTTTQTNNPCYAFTGGLNLGGLPAVDSGIIPLGLCANSTNAQFFLNFGSSTPARINFPFTTNTGGSLIPNVIYDSPVVLKANPTLTFTAISAQTCQEQTVSITNSTTSMLASASPQTTLGSVNLSWSAWVSAAGTVSVRVCNPSAGSITPNAVVWNVAAMIL